MTRILPLIVLFLVAVAAAARGQDGAQYHELLARAQAGDTTVDFTALRRAWAASPEYAPYGSDADEHLDSVRAALQRKAWDRAVRAADAALAVNWLDAATHVLKAYAMEQMGDAAGAGREREVAARVVRSVAGSGKGTEQVPFVVVTLSAEC
jgi:hypothetical protein